jgi:hypothetical protein
LSQIFLCNKDFGEIGVIKARDMKKPKLTLQPFEIKTGTELSAEFLSKILGGVGGDSDNADPPSGSQDSNAPEYSVSATSSMEVEIKNES